MICRRRSGIMRRICSPLMILLLALLLLIYGCGGGTTGSTSGGSTGSSGGTSNITAVTVQGTVTGEFGAPVRSATLSFSASGRSGTDYSTSATTNSKGVFSATLYNPIQYAVTITGGQCSGYSSLSTVSASFAPSASSLQFITLYKPGDNQTYGCSVPSVLELVATAASPDINLSWTPSADSSFHSYRIYRSTSSPVSTSGNLVAEITDAGNTSFCDHPGNAGTYYYALFHCTGANGYYASTGSNEVSATTTSSGPGNTSYLLMLNDFGTPVIDIGVASTGSALPSGSYTATLPAGSPVPSPTALTYVQGPNETMKRVFYGLPVAGSYTSYTKAGVAGYQDSYENPIAGNYTITTPSKAIDFTGIQAPSATAFTVNASANSDGTISASWTNLGPDYKYLIRAVRYMQTAPGSGLILQPNYETYWANVDPAVLNGNCPDETFMSSINMLYAGNSCIIPPVFYDGDQVYVQVYAIDTGRCAYDDSDSTMGKGLAYYSLNGAQPVTISGGAIKEPVYGLFIGINAYPKSPLQYCVADAQGMRDSLKSSDLWSAATIYELYDSDATKANILDRISQVANLIRQGETFFIDYSGHGSNDGTHTYIVPVDGSSTDKTTFISDSDLQSALSPISSKGAKIVILFDSCFSGGFIARMAPGFTARFYPMPGSVEHLTGLVMPRALSLQNMIFLAAAKGSEFSWESGDIGHGAFTYYCMEGLAQGSTIGPADSDADAEIGGVEAFNYAGPKTSAWATANGATQTPQLENTSGGDISIKK